MAEAKKTLFNPDAAEEYFSMLLAHYRDTANDIFRRDNEGRPASEQHYSAEYQKYVGMQIAVREVLEYFSKFDLGGWISVKERLPEYKQEVLVFYGGAIYTADKMLTWEDGHVTFYIHRFDEWREVTHWMPLPEPPKEK